MTEYREQITNFYCQKIKSNVKITCKILVHRGSASGVVDAEEFPTSFDCDHVGSCEVSNKDGVATKYDWKKCVHPQMKE